MGYAVAGTLNRLGTTGIICQIRELLSGLSTDRPSLYVPGPCPSSRVGCAGGDPPVVASYGRLFTPETPEESYFTVTYDKMDLCLWAYNHGVPAEDVAPLIDLTPAQVARVYRDIESKRQAKRFSTFPYHDGAGL